MTVSTYTTTMGSSDSKIVTDLATLATPVTATPVTATTAPAMAYKPKNKKKKKSAEFSKKLHWMMVDHAREQVERLTRDAKRARKALKKTGDKDAELKLAQALVDLKYTKAHLAELEADTWFPESDRWYPKAKVEKAEDKKETGEAKETEKTKKVETEEKEEAEEIAATEEVVAEAAVVNEVEAVATEATPEDAEAVEPIVVVAESEPDAPVEFVVAEVVVAEVEVVLDVQLTVEPLEHAQSSGADTSNGPDSDSAADCADSAGSVVLPVSSTRSKLRRFFSRKSPSVTEKTEKIERTEKTNYCWDFWCWAKNAVERPFAQYSRTGTFRDKHPMWTKFLGLFAH